MVALHWPSQKLEGAVAAVKCRQVSIPMMAKVIPTYQLCLVDIHFTIFLVGSIPVQLS